MKCLFLNLVLSALFFTIAGCNKNPNPCEGMLSQAPPRTVGLVVLDETNGKNILLNTPDADDIKVYDEESGKLLPNWRIIQAPDGHPLNGALELPLFDQTEGDHSFDIQINGIEPIILSYTISKGKNDNPCLPYLPPLTALKVLNHTWELFENEGKPVPNIVVIRISKK